MASSMRRSVVFVLSVKVKIRIDYIYTSRGVTYTPLSFRVSVGILMITPSGEGSQAVVLEWSLLFTNSICLTLNRPRTSPFSDRLIPHLVIAYHTHKSRSPTY